MGEAVADIRRRIEETRSRLDEIVEATVHRLDPRSRAHEAVQRSRVAFRDAADAAVEIPRLLAEARANGHSNRR